MTPQQFLSRLAKETARQVKDPLPERFYTAPMKALVAALPDVPDHEDFLSRSVKSLVGYSKTLKPHLTTPATFSQRLDTSPEKVRPIFDALTAPFRGASYFSHGAKWSKYDGGFSYTDDKARQRGNDRLEEEIRESQGDLYPLYQMLQRTPYLLASDVLAFMSVPIPFRMDREARFQHTWIVSPTGTGKTTLIENLISEDLPLVMQGKASLFIMDSQNELIPRVASIVPPGKVVLLEPDDAYPLALNIFDNQVIDYSTSLELADFVMAGLLGADLTAKQKGIFRYLTQALQVIPDATIHTFADLLGDGYSKYERYIKTLDPYTVSFFETRFNTQSFKSTKEEIFWRLDAIMSNVTFRKMFSHKRNKVDLYKELGEAKVICVNTNLALLKAEGTEIFGRFFLAMLLQATERRSTTTSRLPVFAYLDEAHDYIATEPKMAILLDKARKQRVAFTLAHQRMANIKSPDVLDALANVRVKFAAKNLTDADYLAKLFRIESEALKTTPDWHFWYTEGKGSTLLQNPQSVITPGKHYREHQDRMRALYCGKEELPEKSRPAEKEEVDISPSKDW